MMGQHILVWSVTPDAWPQVFINAVRMVPPSSMFAYAIIIGFEKAMLLRTLVALSRPRQALDIGCFTG